jgi:RNA polymerase sigma-70 factor, ECF subfamily
MQPDATKPSHSTLSDPTDADLIRALGNGQVNALGVIYDRYSSLVYGLALRILRNAEEAEDLTQEVFLTLRRNIYDPKRGALSSFLITLTRSRSIDKLRSRNTRSRFLQRWRGMIKSEAMTNPLEQASLHERSQLIRDALAQLSENERQVLEIAYYEGLSQSEIARRLDAPLGTVKTRSRQGLLKLKQILQDFIQ